MTKENTSMPAMFQEFQKFADELRDQQVEAHNRMIKHQEEHNNLVKDTIEDQINASKINQEAEINRLRAFLSAVISSGNAQIDALTANRDSVAGGVSTEPIKRPKERDIREVK